MTLVAGHLHLAPKPEHGLSLPIDVFFRSMAEEVGGRGVAIVLSGTGSDGARGIPRVNEEGGLVMVQDPTTAKFDGMPRSAIATGLVDVVGPAETLALRLVEHLRTPRHELDAALRRRPTRCRPWRSRWTASWSCCWPAAASTSASTSRTPCCAASSAACRCCTAQLR
ncbi:MAG: chemotaxis protein CheB [Burkholderiaceae bacterium]|nr:chemotaxis protein CheB [Burkholderiaceae bacterium]